MLLHRKYSLALVLGVASFAVMSKPLHAETLEQAIQSAMQNHPSVATAKVGSESAQELKREERSGYFPDIGISGQGGRIYGDNSTSRGLSVTRGAAYSNYWEGSFTARQMLFDGFATSNRLESAKAKVESADMDLLDTQERLAFNVAQSYIDLMRARKGLALLNAHSKKVADYEARIAQMVEDGGADEAEHQQARDISVILDSMIADYKGQAHKAEAYYMELTGHLPVDDLTMPTPDKNLIPREVDEAIAYAKANHPALQSASYMSESAAFDAKAEKAALYPNIDGEFSYLESEKDDIIGGEVTDGRAVVRMNWNFETGGAQLARIQQKHLAEKESQSRAREIETQLERVIRMAYADHEVAMDQLSAQEKRYGLNQKLFETYKIQFDGARITLLQLMQSDNQLFTTQLEKMNGAFRALSARYAILASMGRLQESMNTNLAQASSQEPSGASPLIETPKDEQK